MFGSTTYAAAPTVSDLDADLASLTAVALARADRRRRLATATARRA